MNDNDKVVMIPFFVAESMADRQSTANKKERNSEMDCALFFLHKNCTKLARAIHR